MSGGKVSQAEVDDALKALTDAYESLVPNKTEGDVLSAPVANIPSGEVPSGTEITLSCATEGASIYYTTDESEPSVKDELLYKSPILVNEPVTIKAMAVKDGYQNSAVATYAYTISQTDPDKFVHAPTADVPSGKVDKGTKVTLTCATEGAPIYYTTDKSEPTAAGATLYESPVIVNEPVTIKAVAVKGENTSAVSTFVYDVSQGGDDKPVQVSAPTADIASGTELLLKGTRITLTCETEGAAIYYTTDGNEPAVRERILSSTAMRAQRPLPMIPLKIRSPSFRIFCSMHRMDGYPHRTRRLRHSL